MKLNSKGQVTIPAPLRAKHGLHEGDEIDVIEEDGALRIVRVEGALSRGTTAGGALARTGHRARTQDMTTDELMEPLRGE